MIVGMPHNNDTCRAVGEDPVDVSSPNNRIAFANPGDH